MASDVAALERLDEQAIAVDAQAIEEEFDAHLARDRRGERRRRGGTRARVDLIAVGGAADDRERFEEVMETLPQRHPCRGIFAPAAAP